MRQLSISLLGMLILPFGIGSAFAAKSLTYEDIYTCAETSQSVKNAMHSLAEFEAQIEALQLALSLTDEALSEAEFQKAVAGGSRKKRKAADLQIELAKADYDIAKNNLLQAITARDTSASIHTQNTNKYNGLCTGGKKISARVARACNDLDIRDTPFCKKLNAD